MFTSLPPTGICTKIGSDAGDSNISFILKSQEGGGGGAGVEQDLYLKLHCHHHNDLCTKPGNDESHLNVSSLVKLGGGGGGGGRTIPNNNTQRYTLSPPA